MHAKRDKNIYIKINKRYVIINIFNFEYFNFDVWKDIYYRMSNIKMIAASHFFDTAFTQAMASCMNTLEIRTAFHKITVKLNLVNNRKDTYYVIRLVMALNSRFRSSLTHDMIINYFIDQYVWLLATANRIR